MSQPSLSLVVLQTATLHSVVAFYRTVGLKFVEEKHGNGPIHYACALGTTVIEIYPGKDGAAPSGKNGGATMLGFELMLSRKCSLHFEKSAQLCCHLHIRLSGGVGLLCETPMVEASNLQS